MFKHFSVLACPFLFILISNSQLFQKQRNAGNKNVVSVETETQIRLCKSWFDSTLKHNV